MLFREGKMVIDTLLQNKVQTSFWDWQTHPLGKIAATFPSTTRSITQTLDVLCTETAKHRGIFPKKTDV